MADIFISAFVGAIVGCCFDTLYKVLFEKWLLFYFSKCDAIYLGSETDILKVESGISCACSTQFVVRGNVRYIGIIFSDTYDNVCDAGYIELFNRDLGNLYWTRRGRAKKRCYS